MGEIESRYPVVTHDACQAMLDQANAEIERLKAQVEVLEEEHGDLVDWHVTLCEQVSNLQVERDELQDDIRDLRRRLAVALSGLRFILEIVRTPGEGNDNYVKATAKRTLHDSRKGGR